MGGAQGRGRGSILTYFSDSLITSNLRPITVE